MAVLAQSSAPVSGTKDGIFSGTVTSVAPDKVTVVRKAPARTDQIREFAVDPGTKVEGRLRVNARVSVRFRNDVDSVSHALRIIVRNDARLTGGPGAPGPPARRK
jgi:hypothetical protein